MPGEVRTRAVELPGDAAFLLSVYDTTRRAETSLMGWSDTEMDAFIAMQFDAQTRHYATAFPDATSLVVLVGDVRAGRLIVDRSEERILIVDITLLPEFRGTGVGRELVRPLLEEADAAGLPVRLHVAHDNDARAFWEYLGFVAQGLDGLYVAMERATSR
jgi:ribosomal protein S18 acetylase RimI-like enzyme